MGVRQRFEQAAIVSGVSAFVVVTLALAQQSGVSVPDLLSDASAANRRATVALPLALAAVLTIGLPGGARRRGHERG